MRAVPYIDKRLRSLETKIAARHGRLSPSQRRILTDKAVWGDVDALAELALARSAASSLVTPEQRSATVAAAMRADE